ncbi:histidine phosphatase family protein [Tautonia sociabilis]|uniref:Histidine phosphatase family protein n=1 Tax=Tautonia sociabilis TaxID=2080755 RepID=A0A432MPX6_9BACT|nr:histidine phosphatase family protein [Tautonia sociabilis]RUL89068.1 histidine phosphatase family protein [Tautonia sociabilis]
MTIDRPADTRPTRVLLLRHAQTSAPDRFHGAESDVGLGPEGWLQAQEAAEALAGLRPGAVYCSAMRRARETAGPIAAACGLDPIVVPELHERRMGPLSGSPIAEVRAEVDRFIDRWGTGDHDAAHEGGESYRAIRDRVVPPFVSLAERHPGETVIAVLHGVVIRVLISALIDGFSPADYRRIAIRHVAVNDLRFDGETWRAEALDLEPTALLGSASGLP